MSAAAAAGSGCGGAVRDVEAAWAVALDGDVDEGTARALDTV
jgi:hypothetical protein